MNSGKVSKLASLMLLVILLIVAATANAQDIFGVISGSVTDSTGALVVGAKVTIRNEETKQGRVVLSNSIGFYTAPQLAVGRYSVTAEKQGFKTYTVAGTDLNAGAHATVDLSLPVGSTSESVIVSTTGETINTASAEIARTVDSQQVQTLALNERNFVQLTTIVPGAATVSFDQTAMTTGMSTTAAAINGMRTDQNLFTVDGGYNMDSGSNSSQLNNVGIDFVQEVTVQTSNFSAEYGRNAASSVNVVTKSGTNQFHGGVFEFVRNQIFDAANPGSKLNITPTTKLNTIKPPLRYNDFGWDLGGPIWHDKVFFFVGEEWKRLRLAATAQNLTVPTSRELSGDFSDTPAITLVKPPNAPLGCTIVANVLSPACITADGKAIANVYTLMEKQAAAFNDTPSANNATFQPNNPQNWREDIIRIDYHPAPKHSIYFRYLHDDLKLIDAFGTFTPGGLPTTPTTRIRPGYSFQLGHIWMTSPKLINEAKFNVSWNKQRIPPEGDTWKRSTYAFAFPLPFPNAGSYPQGIPHVTFTGVSGAPITGLAQFSGPYFSLLAPTTDISPSDTLTALVGQHTLKFGVLFARNRKDQNSRPNSYNGAINFQAGGNPNSTGNPVADALMGNFQTFSQQSADPVGHFRFNNLSLFAMDNWKVTTKLSLELGLRFEYTTPTYTQGNNMANFDPAAYSASTAPTSISSKNVPSGPNLNNGYVVDGLVRPGNVPSDQYRRVPGATSSFVNAVPATAPRGFFDTEALFGPRIGVAYTVDSKTVLRAGFGLFFDKPEGNIIFGQPGVVPFLQSVTYQNGNLANPTGGGSTVPTIFGMSAVDPKLRVARNGQYSLSVQNQAAYGLLFQLAYVGNASRHMVRQPNINAPSFAEVAAHPGLAANQIRQYFGYTDITQYRSDGTSNYNALQLSAVKRRGNLMLTLNYTWSKALATNSVYTDNAEPECPFSCVTADGKTLSWRQFLYGTPTFDRRNIFTATYTYTLPVFKSRHDVLGQALGGWSISGITRAQSGQPLTISATQSIGPSSTPGSAAYSRRANFNPGAHIRSGYQCPTGKICWFNPANSGSTAAFVLPSNSAPGNAPIGNVIGPAYFGTDLSLRKTFGMPREMGLLIQADAFNVFNRTNWGNPGTSVNSGLGLITSSNPPRQLQFGAKFNF
ncbi:MAG TPA: carboxypeptidase regulatory-like domain-containing protein [Acidisarcina sp.]|nr:carboxypeptidase regulatory-like domain-containing protein [Acidisarcina sp.]